MITVRSSSRYKDSFAYTYGSVREIGPFQPPREILVPGAGWAVHKVIQTEVGFPDMLAAKYFGPGMEELWWAVCLPNGIIEPSLDMYPGQRLSIPPQRLIAQFVSRSSNAR